MIDAGRTRRERNAEIIDLNLEAEAIRARYQPEIDAIKLSRRTQVATLKERHHDDVLREDAALQAREAERELGREMLKQQIDTWKKSQRDTSDRQTAPASRLGTDWTAKEEPARERMPEQRTTGVHRQPDEDDGRFPAADPPHGTPRPR
ncbi:MAG: hypothetical protein DLM68_06535 [Hyphomicrobiales bacterium]|nr:MAG: hypothetical protein DLM68_06535 [Hyphomicrobiales bacterium]